VKFNDASHLSLAISDQILKAPPDILQVICSSLGYSCKSASIEHSRLTHWWQAQHHSLQENVQPSFRRLFDRFEKLSRPEAPAIAASHGLSPLGTVNDIKSSLVAHIAEAECTQLSETVPVLPPACVKLREDCPSELSQIPDNQNEMRIFFLSQIGNTIRRRPLCRLLQLYDIQHDAKSSTSVLRRSLKHYINDLRKGKSANGQRCRTFPPTSSRTTRLRENWPQMVDRWYHRH
jgi:hypothetical protein